MKPRNTRITDAILRVAGLAMLVMMVTAYGYSIALSAGTVG